VIAEGVRETDLADYQRAARTLLVTPLVTASHPDAGALPLVRRFAAPLGVDLDAVAGYRLELAATCARLVRRVDRFDTTQLVRRGRDRKPFDRRRYAYLCLVLAALGRAGPQVALTELADALRRRAAEIDGLGFDPDEYRHRLAFVDVVRHLLSLGAVTEVESSTTEWVRDPDAGEALYDLERDVLHQVFVPPRVIQHVRSAGALLTTPTASSRDGVRTETRQRLGRLLLEQPVLHLDDLDDAERGYLANQGRRLADDLHRLTGGQLERRAEGLALIDATGGFSDRRFPAGGTAGQVALLLADAMAGEVGHGEVERATVPSVGSRDAATIARLDQARPWTGSGSGVTPGLGDEEPEHATTDRAPGPPHTGVASRLRDEPAAADERHLAQRHPGGTHAGGEPDPATQRTVGSPVDDESDADPAADTSGPLFTDAWLEERAAALGATHGRSFAADLRDDPAALAAAAVQVLSAFDLVRAVPGGVVARPALARYRDVTVNEAPSAQPSLLSATQDTAPGPEDR
jgi:uncharacterized protein (TIGR02678 family)